MAPTLFERIGIIEIRPASLAQLTKARGGRLVEVDDDVQGIANALARIDSHIRLRYSEFGLYFVVYWLPDEWEEGNGYMIFTARDLDHRIVKRMEEVYARCNARGYSFADDLEAAEARQKREDDHAWREENGELMEKLAWALREDSNRNQHKAFIREGVKS